MINVTTNEAAVLKSLFNNNFGDAPGDWVWANCINDSRTPSGLENRDLSGTFASLCKKGLAESDGLQGRDRCVRLTKSGIEAAM